MYKVVIVKEQGRMFHSVAGVIEITTLNFQIKYIVMIGTHATNSVTALWQVDEGDAMGPFIPKKTHWILILFYL